MSQSQDDILIEKYLQGDLIGADLEAFESRLKSDPKFAERLTFLKEVEIALSDPTANKMLSELNQLGDEFFKSAQAPKAKVRSLSANWMRIAAGLVLILGLAFALRSFLGQNPGDSDLFATYFEPYDLSSEVRGEGDPETYSDALERYNSGAFAEATAILEKLLKEDPENEELSFYLAMSQLAETPPALDQAESVLTSLAGTSGVYAAPSKWYLALIYLAKKEPEKARPYLEEVKSSGGKRGKKAAEILKDL